MAKQKLPPGVPPGDGGAPMQRETPPPPFGTPKPASDGGDLPRVIDPLERAPTGLKRFKVRCNNYSPHGLTKYILAQPDQEDAVKALYLKDRGIQTELDKLAKRKVEVVEPDLVVTVLPD